MLFSSLSLSLLLAVALWMNEKPENRRNNKQKNDQMHIFRVQLNYIFKNNPNGMILDVLQYDAQIKCRYYKLECENAQTVTKMKQMSFARTNEKMNIQKQKVYTEKKGA